MKDTSGQRSRHANGEIALKTTILARTDEPSEAPGADRAKTEAPR